MCPLNEGSVLSRLIAEMMVGLHESYMSLMVLLVMGIVSELVLQGNDSGTVVAGMFYPFVSRNISSDIPSVPVIHVQ